MSNRSNRRSNGNAIRGPQSALTDFLASHNISAHQISQDYQHRQREAERQQAQQEAAAQDEDEEEASDDDEDSVERRKRNRKEETALMKIKQSKEFKRRKHEAQRNGDEEEDDDTIAKRMMQKAKPLPGQLANCELCEKRFTVTPYCKTGPEGGLLCMKCSKELKDEEKRAQAQEKKKKAQPRARKRQTESDRLMGDVKPGSKSLVEQCVKRVADVVHDIDEFGDLQQNLLDKMSQILSKRRVITPRTLKLFLQPDIDRIAIYDCGKLESEDYQQIFTFMPDLEFINLRFAGQLKDEQLHYMIEKTPKLRHLQLDAANLVSDAAWTELFQKRGFQLESLKLSAMNDSLNDTTVAELGLHCKKLKRLKLRSCTHMTEASLNSIAQLKSLEHLTLSVARDASPSALVRLVETVGANLQTLCLERYFEADDTVLKAITATCSNLTKLRLVGNSIFTDAAFAELFGSTFLNPPMSHIDLSSNRDLECSSLDENGIEPIGLGSNGFLALMNHSGRALTRLDLHSSRHISHEALLEVFDGTKQYPHLKDIDLSFVRHVDDVVMEGIFKSCPKLQELAVIGCFNARGARVPPGIAVLGLLHIGDNIHINEHTLMGM